MKDVTCIFCRDAPATRYKDENGYRAVQCTGCGLVFVSPRPTLAEMKALYEGQETKINLRAHLGKRDNKTVEAKKSLKLIREFCRAGTLLEVGSAAGYFLAEAKRQGFRVQGLDITRQFVEFSNNVLGVPAFEGTLRDAPFETGAFDVVYMRNVVSHLAYPLEEFTLLNRLLRPGCHLILETGNVAEMPPERSGELELPDHLFHFSEKTIRLLFERTGFETVEIRRFALLFRLAPIAWLERLVTRPSRTRSASGKGTSTSDPSDTPATLPPSSPVSRWKTQLGQFLRYDVGAALPKKGARCAIVAIGRKP